MSAGRTRRVAGTVLSVVVACSLMAPAAQAYDFTRRVKPGATGRDVRALQVRIAGWHPTRKQTFAIDGAFGGQTMEALRAFEAAYGRPVNGVASPKDLKILNRLQDRDGSTEHFDFSEFDQNRSSSCSSKANSYAGTFSGGMSQPKRVRRNVRRLMWRLETVRKKGGSQPIGINSGFRSISYNDCIGGARASQHLYGTAADNRMVGVDNRTQRRLAKGSQVHGIGCYSNMSHNHFDVRIDNKDLPSGHFWWWPKKDSKGRELADGGRPCWGQRSSYSARPTGTTFAETTTGRVLREIQESIPGAGSLVPNLAEIEAFEEAGEVEDLDGGD